MKTLQNITNTQKTDYKNKLSKAGKAMKAKLWKGSIVEISNDPWNLAQA